MGAPERSERRAKPKLDDLTVLKGMGIVLVVFGHLARGDHPPTDDWYFQTRTLIYSFHMPLFLYISGFLLLRNRSGTQSWEATRRHIGQRAERLLVPFALFGLIIVLGQHAAMNFTTLDKVHDSLVQDILALVVHTDTSSAISVWYLFVAFLAGTLALLFRMVSHSTLILLAIALVVSFLPVDDILYFDRLASYAPFFVLGMLAGEHEEKWLAAIDRYIVWFGLAFVAVFAITRFIDSFQLALDVCGVTAVPFCHGLARRMVRGGRYRTLFSLGTFSMAIYLLNTIAIGLTKSVWNRLAVDGDLAFAGYIVVAMTIGVMLPIAVKIIVFRRLRYIDRMTS